MSDRYAAVCKYQNTASGNTHALGVNVNLSLGAGVSLAFCVPKEEAGLCLEGSIKFVEVGLTPSMTYTHHAIKDARGRSGAQSKITFSLDWDLAILAGSIDVKVVFGKWFSFTYNLFSFPGLVLPVGGNLVKKEFSILQELQ